MIEILTISIIAWWIAVGLGWVQVLKWWLKVKRIRFQYKGGVITEKRLKPFDCPKCLAFWGAWFYFLATGNPLGYVLIYAILSSTFAIVIEKGMTKL